MKNRDYTDPDEIRALRARHGLTQEQLTRLLKLSHKQMVQRWESGNPPTLGSQKAIELLDTMLTLKKIKGLPRKARDLVEWQTAA